ncbi:MAG: thermonuclease family protein [Cyanobacteria bacterium HKST-UBA02]|nr:thermonuclease family protein [Cyanobacteria bacterium HKST-UBA02]
MRYIVAVEGTVDTSQFWPRGTSDADTIKLDISRGGFYYGTFDARELAATEVFEGAYCLVEDDRMKPLISKKRIVDIRLQGVDAPELHLPVEMEGLPTEHYRQYFGKTATVKLLKALGGADQVLPCQVWSYVDSPADLFDAYGRLIGDVFINPGTGAEFHVNAWLVEKGHAVPTFYASMQPEEIAYLRELARRALKAGRGLWEYLINRVRRTDLKLRFRYSDRIFDQARDLGPVLFPKVFRRAAHWMAALKEGSIEPDTPFRDYLISQPPVVFTFTDDFLHHGPYSMIPRYYLEDVISQSGSLDILPMDAVFFEALSRIYDSNGREIKAFEEDPVGLLKTVKVIRILGK